MTQKSKIALIVAILVIVVGVGIVLATDAGGLQGLIFKRSRITIDYKKQLPPCTKLIMPKISSFSVNYAKPNDNYFGMAWSIKGLCGTAKVDLYIYTGEALVYTAKANMKPNYVMQNSAGDGLFYYTFNGKYAGDMGPMAKCAAGKPCMFKVKGGIAVNYYSTEAKTHTNFFPVSANPKLKQYALIKISDQDGNELGRSDIVAVYSEKIPSISSFNPVGLNNGNNFKLKWSVKNMSPGYQLELRVYTSDILAYTAEANKKIQSIPDTLNLAYYTVESNFASALFEPAGKKIGPIYSSEAGPLYFFTSTDTLKRYFALFVKKNDIGYIGNYSPVLAIFKAPSTAPTKPSTAKTK